MTPASELDDAIDAEWGVPATLTPQGGAPVPCVAVVMSGTVSQSPLGQPVDDEQVVVSVRAGRDVQVSSQGDQLRIDGGDTYLIARVRAYAGRLLFDLQGPV